MARFIGRSGEKRFSGLCSDLGITCNEPREDDHGWDHIVELPWTAMPGVSADLRRAVPPIFVQTKSHEADGLTITMRLSNAMKLARSPNPCFVVLASLGPPGTSPLWHAIHFWDDILLRALKRAREASRDGVSEDDFNHRTFSFTMTADDRVEEAELLPWIERTVRAVGPDYAEAKKALAPDPEVTMNIKIGPLASLDALMDHVLGLTETVPVTLVSASQRRFDVDVPFQLPEGGTYRATLHSKPLDRCDIRLRGFDGGEIELVGDVIAPLLPGLSQEKHKFRFRTPMLDIIISPEAGTTSIASHFVSSERMAPAALEQRLMFASWVGQGPIHVWISINDDPVFEFAIELVPFEEPEYFAHFARMAGTLSRMSRHLRSRVPQISMDDVARADHVGPFHRFATTASMKSEMEVGETFVTPEASFGVAFAIIPVGDWVFAVIQQFPILEIRHAGTQLTIDFGQPVVLQTYAFPQSDPAMKERLTADYLRHASQAATLSLNNALVGVERQDPLIEDG